MFAGAQGIHLLFNMARIKCISIILGPAGLGLLGTFQILQGFTGAVAGMGIASSGVRNIAERGENADRDERAKTIVMVRRLSMIGGFVGGFLLVIASLPLSQLTFNTEAFAPDIALLGIAVLLACMGEGERAVIQGMRRIRALSKLLILTAFAATISTVGLYWCLGIRGIVPSLVAIAAIDYFGSRSVSRGIHPGTTGVTWRESLCGSGNILRLGVAYMWSAALSTFVMYLARLFILREFDLPTLGVYTAAFVLSGLFVNFLLAAMAADYYPALAAASSDHIQMRKLVNAQTEIGMLLALPGVLATVALAPWIIKVFYTSEFSASADLLQWFVLGCFGRVVSFPLSYVVLALDKSGLYFVITTLAEFVHLALLWIGLQCFGLIGVAIAFCALLVFTTFMGHSVARKMIGFVWTREVLRLLWLLYTIVIAMFLATRLLPAEAAALLGIVVTGVASLVCLRKLVDRVGFEHPMLRGLHRLPGIRLVCRSEW